MNWMFRSAMEWLSFDQFVDAVGRSIWNSLIGPCANRLGRCIPARFKVARLDIGRVRDCVVGLLLLLPVQPQVGGVLSRLMGASSPMPASSWAMWCRFLLTLVLLERLHIVPGLQRPGLSQGWVNLWRQGIWDSTQRQIVSDRFLRRASMAALLVSVSWTGWLGMVWFVLGGAIVLRMNLVGGDDSPAGSTADCSLTPPPTDPPIGSPTSPSTERSLITGGLPLVGPFSEPVTVEICETLFAPSSGPLTRLEERQTLIAHHVRMVAEELLEGLFVYGRQGGLGKTTTVLRTLAAKDIQPVIINSHVTLVGLFQTLYDHRDRKIIVFDDCDAIFRALPQLGLLRSALYGEPRTITLVSSKLPSGLPSQFEFRSRIIFCANVLPKANPAFDAVLTRCAVLELSATNEEVLETMRTIAARGFRSLSSTDCLEAVEFIANRFPPEGLSLRLLVPTWQRVIYARNHGIDWQPLVEATLTGMSQVAQ